MCLGMLLLFRIVRRRLSCESVTAFNTASLEVLKFVSIFRFIHLETYLGPYETSIIELPCENN